SRFLSDLVKPHQAEGCFTLIIDCPESLLDRKIRIVEDMHERAIDRVLHEPNAIGQLLRKWQKVITSADYAVFCQCQYRDSVPAKLYLTVIISQKRRLGIIRQPAVLD